MKSFPTMPASGTMETRTPPATRATTHRWPRDHRRIARYRSVDPRANQVFFEEGPLSPAPACLTFRNREASIGVRVKEMNQEKRIANATVIPYELKNRPTVPAMKATGRKMT